MQVIVGDTIDDCLGKTYDRTRWKTFYYCVQRNTDNYVGGKTDDCARGKHTYCSLKTTLFGENTHDFMEKHMIVFKKS